MDNAERLESAISSIRLYFGRKLWDMRGQRPLQVHERLLKTPDQWRRQELESAFREYIEDVGRVLREAASEYREIAGGFSDNADTAISLIEASLQYLVSETEGHVRSWLFAACGESLTEKTLDAIVHGGKSRPELAAQWHGPPWLLAERARKIRDKSRECDEQRALLRATDQLQEEMEETVSLRLGAGVVGDEMLLIKARFLSVQTAQAIPREIDQEEAEDEEALDPQARDREAKPLRIWERIVIEIIECFRNENQNQQPPNELVCKEIDRRRRDRRELAHALSPRYKWFTRTADEDIVPEDKRTWQLAYYGAHRTAVINAINRAWNKRALLRS